LAVRLLLVRVKNQSSKSNFWFIALSVTVTFGATAWLYGPAPPRCQASSVLRGANGGINTEVCPPDSPTDGALLSSLSVIVSASGGQSSKSREMGPLWVYINIKSHACQKV
jgi:hypothetical protein